MKYCVKIWTNNKPILTSLKIPESFHGNSVKLLEEGTHKSISLDYSREHIEIDIDDENHWAPRCVRAGIITLIDNDLADFLSITKDATFGFFTFKIKELNSIYLMAILNDNMYKRLSLIPLSK